MYEDRDTLIEQSQQLQCSDCFIRVSRFLHDFLLAIFDAILLEFSCDIARKKCEF